jgi:alpha-glucosidase
MYMFNHLSTQPDLNWWNDDVRAEFDRIIRFWFDRGVAGFRIDVVHCLVKRPDLPDMPEGRDWSQDRFDEPATHDVVRGVRHVAEEYAGDRVLVGEVYVMSTAKVAEFYGDGDELHLAFNFPPLYAPWDAAKWRKRIDRAREEFDPRHAWPTWVLSTHDNPRHRTRYGSEARSRAAAVLLLTLRGTPFLYAGEELGLEDAVIPDDAVVDPGGRDGCRAPIPWDTTPGHGWGDATPWLPWPPDPDVGNAETRRADTGSILHLYRRILRARRSSAALQVGTWEPLAAPDGVLAYRRAADGDERIVIVNFTDEELGVPIDGDLDVEVASDGAGEGGPYAGRVGASGALILRARS